MMAKGVSEGKKQIKASAVLGIICSLILIRNRSFILSKIGENGVGRVRREYNPCSPADEQCDHHR